MTLYLETPEGFTPWAGQPIAGIVHPRDIEQKWGAEELEAIGLYSPAPAEPVPANHYVVSTSVQRVGGVVRYVNVTAPIVVTPDDVWAERDRRLALGFDHDFGDARGVHHFRTTPADMVGWDEVSKFAQALLNAGQTDTTINIATATGVTQVTPVEWQAVLISAAAFRQPIWAASFVLEAMDPIPNDYRDDAYWPSAS